MKKLFKEVWKSFANSKIVLAGLTLLVFLTSGIITLIFDVNKTYTNQYDNYKNTSQLQDVTMNTNIEPKGSKPNPTIYVQDGLPNTWTHISPRNKKLNSIRINTDKKYYDLSSLINSSQPFYVSVKDLSTILNMNINSLNNINPNNGSSDATITFDKNNRNILKIYDAQGNPLVESIKNIQSINKRTWSLWTGYKWNSTSKVSDLYDVKTNKFKPLLLDTHTSKAYICDDYSQWKTDDIYKYYISTPNRFFLLESDSIAQWFGFKKLSPTALEYTFDLNLKTWIVNEDFPTQNLDIQELLKKEIKPNFDVNTNDVILNLTGNSIIESQVSYNINDLPNFATLKIPKSWFVYSQTTYQFTKYSYKLQGIDENNNIENSWSGIYKDYLLNIKEKDIKKFNILKSTSYWTKEQLNTLVDFDGNEINTYKSNELIDNGKSSFLTSLESSDLNLEIENKNNKTTIAQIEKLNQNEINEDVATQLNTNINTENETSIESNSLALAYQNIFNEIKQIVGKIGIRENITVNSNNENESHVFQFINLGNSNNEIDWHGIKVKQEVGKLGKISLDSPIFKMNSNINAQQNVVPLNNVPQILDVLLNGLSLNRDYINSMISFESFSYEESNQWLEKQDAKIIWLTPMNDSYNREKLVGISAIRNQTENSKDYYVLSENNGKYPNLNTHWISLHKFNTFEKMKKFIIDNELNFAPFGYYYGIDGNDTDKLDVVSKKGWAKQNATYIDQYSAPFQYLLPSSEIVDGFNNGHGMELFKQNLIANLTNNVKSIISPNIWNVLMEAVDYSFTNFGFGEGLTPPAAISNLVIEKIIIGAFAWAASNTNQPFVNILLTDVFLGIKNQALNYSNDPLKQNEYIIQQIKKIEFMLKMTTNKVIPPTVWNLIQNMNSITVIDALIKLINSINLDSVFIELYDLVYNTPNRPINQIVASGDYYPIVYKNITNISLFKKSLVELIDASNIQISGIDISSLISFLSFTEPIEGYTKLKNIAQLKYDANNNVYYSSISLKEFLNLISVPILGGLGDLVNKNYPLPENNDIIYNRNTKQALELDLDKLWYFDNYVFANGNGNIFEIDAKKTLNQAVSSFTMIKEDDGQITYTENLGKIAIVNEAYLMENNKKVYTSNTLENDLNDLSKIDDEYKIKISNVEYVIIDSDVSVDYLYPVINSENITVNTKTQALVYVNQYGYDRIKRSNVNSPTDKYFLIQNKPNVSSVTTQTELNQMVYKWLTNGGQISSDKANLESNTYKKAYLATESSLLNPERALRITVIDSLLSTLSTVQMYVGIILIILTSLVISFVVRRYISSRAKVLGILKAQGYSSLEIATSICLFAFVVSLVGGTLGYIAGHFAQYGMFDLLSLFWTIPIATAGFNWLTLVITIIAPFVLLSILTIIITLWFLRKKPLSLMNGSIELNDSASAKKIQKAVSRTSVKNRFSVNIALNSVGRLIALFISMLFTSSITLFAVATYKIFNKSIDKTFKNRNYTYKVDLISPTIEGGNYYSLDINNGKTNIDNMLYVPVGSINEGYTYLNDYFKPGYNSFINSELEIEPGIFAPANGIIDPSDQITPHILTKSSIDLTVAAGGITINVWNNLYNTIPESQRAFIINNSDKASKWLEWTQEGKEIEYNGKKYITRFMNFNNDKEYLTLFDQKTQTNLQITNQITNSQEDIRIPYFNYEQNLINPENSHFVYRKTTDDNEKYHNQNLIITGTIDQNKIRQSYRDFLVEGYNQMLNFDNNNFKPQTFNFTSTTMPEFSLDYFISPGALLLNNNFETNNPKSYIDETYIYVNLQQTDKQKIQPTLYAYDTNSNFISVNSSSGENLLSKADSFKESNYKPLIINNVVAQKYSLSIGDVMEFEVTNSWNRYQTKLLSKLDNLQQANKKYKFKIIGINDTYINDEWITNKKTAQEILGLHNNEKDEYYNGVFSNSTAPIQLSNSLSLYAHNGYWSATESIFNPDPSYWSDSEKEFKQKTYQQLFYLVSNTDTNKTNNSLVAKNIANAYKNKGQTLTNDEINEKIKKLLGMSINDSLDLSITDSQQIHKAINVFSEIYTNQSLQASLLNAGSNGVEKQYIHKASSTINDGMMIVLTISFAISITILVMITTMIINENERNIAIFGILGYSTREKIRMFFSIYVPIVLISLLLSILVVWLVIPAFSATVLSTSSIALPLGLSFMSVAISSLVVIAIFTLTCIIAWMIQGRIKPIILLKGV